MCEIQVVIILPPEVNPAADVKFHLAYDEKQLVLEQFRPLTNNMLQV
jgi:hypothetical protein